MPQEYTRTVKTSTNLYNRGPVLLFDSMDGFLKWSKTGNAGDYAVTRAQQYVYYDDYTLKCVSRVTDPAEDDYVTAYRYFMLKPSQIAELSFFFLIGDVSANKDAQFIISFDNETDLLKAGIKHTPADGKFYFLNSAGSWEEITGFVKNFTDTTWAFIKFSVDFASEKYISLKVNEGEEDLSDNAIYADATTSATYAKIELTVTTAGAAAATLHVDDLLITEEAFN